MKTILRILCLVALFLSFSLESKAGNRHVLYEGCSIVQYGDEWIIEDENSQMSISIEVAEAGIDRRNNEKMYNVICNGKIKKVAKWGLREAIRYGIIAAAGTEGTSLLISASALAVDIVYDDLCDRWGESFE